MHVDFSFRARANASGNLNTYGVGPVFDTQADRAAAYAALVSDTATVPYVIGSHWFGFADQSPQGRFDGEDGNYGIVDIHNQPYPEMVAAMKATNARVPALHASTKRVMPTELRPRMAASYSPGQRPERPPTLGLLGDWVGPPETWAAPDAKMSWEMRAGELVLNYESGTQYGAGINLFGPKANAIGHGPSLATDLDGYASILIDVTAPKGLQLNIVLAEAGSGTIWTPRSTPRPAMMAKPSPRSPSSAMASGPPPPPAHRRAAPSAVLRKPGRRPQDRHAGRAQHRGGRHGRARDRDGGRPQAGARAVARSTSWSGWPPLVPRPARTPSSTTACKGWPRSSALRSRARSTVNRTRADSSARST